MRVIITGDRAWYCPDLAHEVVGRLLLKYGPALTVIHGAASGVDAAFAEACSDLDVTQERHPADWDRYGKGAGPRRNAEIISAGADLCIAVHRFLPNSKGTKDAVQRAIAAGIPTYLIDSEDAVPRRLAECPKPGRA